MLKTTLVGTAMGRLIQDLGLGNTSTMMVLAAAVVHPSGVCQSEHIYTQNLHPEIAVMIARMLLATWGPKCSEREMQRLAKEAVDLLGTDFTEKTAQ